ncbi:MAG TPA: PQQ-binding-like beta-propeller repeat protein [Mariprofundaceae bacterium]|nr:PQQ-binding-like beta-propeller repeat protein [Mariprofundaceae bacterium]
MPFRQLRKFIAPAAALLLLGGCSLLHRSDEPVKPAFQWTERGGISVVWEADVDQRHPAAPAGFSIPLVTHDGLIVIGGQDKRVRIYSATGSELRRIALKNAVDGGAAELPNGNVVLVDVEGNLYGLDIRKGTIVWQQQLSSVALGRPVVDGNQFFVQTADNSIYAFADDGGRQWLYTGVRSGLAMRAGSSPIVAGDRIYAVLNNGDALALKRDTGDLLWRQQLILENDAPVLSELRVPVADPVLIPAKLAGRTDDLLAVGIYQGELVFLSSLDGSRIRDRNLSLRNTPVLHDNLLYAADSHGAVLALDPASSQSMWKQQLSDGELAGPLVLADAIWVADADGHVTRLGLDGSIQANIALPGSISRSPVATAAGVLVRNDRGTLFLLR